MTTTAEIADQRFAWVAQYGGPVVAWESGSNYRHGVAGEGLSEWHASDLDSSDKPLALRKHVDGTTGTRMLEVRLAYQPEAADKPVRWSAVLNVAEGRYVRADGTAGDFPTALAQVEAHVHESRQIGGLTWWCESQDHWVSWLGAFNLKATRIASFGIEPFWHFEVSGDAPTFEEAALLAVLGRPNMNDERATLPSGREA